MNASEAEATIRSKVFVTPQRVTIAKAIAFSIATSTVTCDEVLDAVYQANQIVVPRPVVLHETVDTDAMLVKVSDAISWRLATIEALWSLVHSGLLVAMGDVSTQSASVDWTTVVPGSGGASAGWQFGDYELPVPSRVRRSPSSLNSPNQFLSEPGLYIHELGVPAMHAEISAAFSEAVRCFRSELYTATLAMLGKASEGAWLELGASLIAAIPHSDESKYVKQRAILEDPMMGTYRKIEAVLMVFDHQELFGTASKSAGVRLQELRAVSVWSDAVRDSRNTIHFNVTPTTPNTYEKVAALLLGAVPYIRILYQVKHAVDAMPRDT
ncbi:MAG: hypothetical protein Q8K52_10010 [Thiobacillus sp.]|nr:hypothetical protein [Thiobacillus sp.]